MPAPQLPLEVILQIVHASLGRTSHQGQLATSEEARRAATAATQSHFEQLRLVSKAAQQKAHRSFPEGVADLARRGASLLLDHTPPSQWSTKLEEVAPVLRITSQLAFVRKTAKPQVDLYHELAWTGGVRAMLMMAPHLLELSLDCAEDPLAFGGLELQHCSALQAIRITNGWKDQLHGLDLTSLDALRSFSMKSVYLVIDLDEALDFRLPSQLATLELSLLGLSAADFAAFVPSLHYLEELQVQDDFRGGQIEAMQLPQMTRLRKLVLNGRKGQGAMREIAKCGALEELDLSYSGLDSVVGLRLHENTTIRILNLSGNELTDPASLGLAFNKSLVELNASNNPFDSMLFGLEQNSTLRTLDLSHCDLHMCILELTEQLTRNATLTTLILRHCEIDDVEVEELHLGQSSGLRSLDLSHVKDITDEGLKPLVESIEKYGLQVRIKLEKTGVSAELRARFA